VRDAVQGTEVLKLLQDNPHLTLTKGYEDMLKLYTALRSV